VDVGLKVLKYGGILPSLDKSSFPKSNVDSSKVACNDSIPVLRPSLASVYRKDI